MALDDEGRISFGDLMRGRGTLAYVAFEAELAHLPRSLVAAIWTALDSLCR